MRTYTLFLAILLTCVLHAQSFVADKNLLDAYLANDMSAWRAYIDAANWEQASDSERVHLLAYEYGYCAALMDSDKTAAKPYVAQFHRHVEQMKTIVLPKGHYEMYMSAVYVYELRLHESFHPVKSLDLAREAVKRAPTDPLTLTYCGMALFYAPKPFGNKKEALQLFLRAEEIFRAPEWYYCWWRPAAMMFAAQCYDKQGNTAEAIRRCETLLTEYPDYAFIRDIYLPGLTDRVQP